MFFFDPDIALFYDALLSFADEVIIKSGAGSNMFGGAIGIEVSDTGFQVGYWVIHGHDWR